MRELFMTTFKRYSFLGYFAVLFSGLFAVSTVLAQTLVAIDIKPSEDDGPNSINPFSKGVTPVAILTTNTKHGDFSDFDASTVDYSTVQFGPAGAFSVRHGKLEDVDKDKDKDQKQLNY